MALKRTNLGVEFRALASERADTTELEVRVRDAKADRLAALRKTLSAFAPNSEASSNTDGTPFRLPIEAHQNTSASPPHTIGLSFALEAVDQYLPSPSRSPGAVHEVIAASHRDRPAAVGFAATLVAHATRTSGSTPLIVVSRAALCDFGQLYAHGLYQLGLDPERLIVVETKSDRDALWAIEEALRAQARLSMVLGLIGSGVRRAGPREDGSAKRTALSDLTISRRLALAAAASGTPLVLALPPTTGETSAATTRWQVRASPLMHRRSSHSVIPCKERLDPEPSQHGRTRWQVELSRSKGGRTGSWTLEWDHDTHRFHLAAQLGHDTLHDTRPAGRTPNRTPTEREQVNLPTRFRA